MADLAKTGGEAGWGDDVFDLTRVRVVGDASSIAAAEEAVRVRYRKELRPRLEAEPAVRRALESAARAVDCREQVLDELAGSCRTGTEDLFEQTVDELLLEIDRLRELPPAVYLVDDRTGKAVLPLKEGSVYQPPDFVGEDGLVHKARPIVHPGISSALALRDQERSRQEGALEKARAAGPSGRHAVAHETDPESMTRIAAEYLAQRGVERGPVPDGEERTAEFGREFYEGILQSPNYGFHRFRMFGEILGRRVLEAMGGPGTCELEKPVLESGSKQRWYRVSFRFRRSS